MWTHTTSALLTNMDFCQNSIEIILFFVLSVEDYTALVYYLLCILYWKCTQPMLTFDFLTSLLPSWLSRLTQIDIDTTSDCWLFLSEKVDTTSCWLWPAWHNWRRWLRPDSGLTPRSAPTSFARVKVDHRHQIFNQPANPSSIDLSFDSNRPLDNSGFPNWELS